MIAFDIEHNGSTLSLELPIPTEVLAGELRLLGIGKTLNQIRQDEFTLKPLNELGEHFMKLVRPDDTLQSIATYSIAPFTLRGGARQAMEDLIIADHFNDLSHIHDYLLHGEAALTHLIRLRLDGSHVDLPSDDLAKHLSAAGFDQTPRQVRLNEVEHLPLNDQGRELLAKCSPYESLATANLACTLLRVPDIDASMQDIMASSQNLNDIASRTADI